MKLIRMIDDYINDNKFYITFKNNQLNIVNYSEIVDFSDTRISIRYEEKMYYVDGDNLVISKMMNNEILITGNICKIIFE